MPLLDVLKDLNQIKTNKENKIHMLLNKHNKNKTKM